MSVKTKVFIVEDNAVARFTLENMLEENGFEILGSEANAEIALSKLIHLRPEIVLLDIQLTGQKTGVWLANKIRKLYQVPIVYLTAYGDSHTLSKVLNTKPDGYLMKPYNEPSLLTTMRIALDSFKRALNTENVASEDKASIVIKVGKESVKVKLNHIKFIQSDGNYLEIVCSDKSYLVRKKLSQFIEELNDPRFMQVHRRYAANLTKIDKLSLGELTIDTTLIPVSKTYQSKLSHEFDTLK